jgi:hypothetical protein
VSSFVQGVINDYDAAILVNARVINRLRPGLFSYTSVAVPPSAQPAPSTQQMRQALVEVQAKLDESSALREKIFEEVSALTKAVLARCRADRLAYEKQMGRY